MIVVTIVSDSGDFISMTLVIILTLVTLVLCDNCDFGECFQCRLF